MLTLSMSELGSCLKAQAASHLGYQPLPTPGFMRLAAREGQRHEEWVAEDLRETGLWVSEAAHCKQCDRDGEHVELPISDQAQLVGHIDRYASPLRAGFMLPNGTLLPPTQHLLEIKALGRWRTEKLVEAIEIGYWGQFDQYGFQISAYHYATGLPILYAVKNRDTGKVNTYAINPPYSLETVQIRATRLACLIQAIQDMQGKQQDEQLPYCDTGDTFAVEHCPFRYLHTEFDLVEENEAL